MRGVHVNNPKLNVVEFVDFDMLSKWMKCPKERSGLWIVKVDDFVKVDDLDIFIVVREWGKVCHQMKSLLR